MNKNSQLDSICFSKMNSLVFTFSHVQIVQGLVHLSAEKIFLVNGNLDFIALH